MKEVVLVLGLSLTLVWPAWAASDCSGSALGVDAANALVLSGGGAKGAWEAGVASALIRGGFPIHLVAGSSAGALNAAMIADGRLDRLEELWRTVTREHVYTLRPSVFFAGLLPGWLTLLVLDRAGSLFDPRPLRELIGSSLDLDRVRASHVRVVVTATDLARRQQRLFDNQTLSIDALMAATAVPGAFPPVAVDGPHGLVRLKWHKLRTRLAEAPFKRSNLTLGWRLREWCCERVAMRVRPGSESSRAAVSRRLLS